MQCDSKVSHKSETVNLYLWPYENKIIRKVFAKFFLHIGWGWILDFCYPRDSQGSKVDCSQTVQALSETSDHLGFKSTMGASVGNYSGRRRETGPLQEGKNRGI